VVDYAALRGRALICTDTQGITRCTPPTPTTPMHHPLRNRRLRVFWRSAAIHVKGVHVSSRSTAIPMYYPQCSQRLRVSLEKRRNTHGRRPYFFPIDGSFRDMSRRTALRGKPSDVTLVSPLHIQALWRRNISDRPSPRPCTRSERPGATMTREDDSIGNMWERDGVILAG
jgi:hypothetical protein